MDLGEFLGGIGTVDLLIVLYFIGFFVLGFAQGTIRRLLGIGSILFSFLLAANLAGAARRVPRRQLDAVLRRVQLHDRVRDGLRRLGVAFALVIQGFYKPQPLFQKARFADEILGGILGLLQAALIFGAVLIILDSFFLIPGIAGRSRRSCRSCATSGTRSTRRRSPSVFRETLIPAFFAADRAASSRTASKRSYPSDLSVIDRAAPRAARRLEAARPCSARASSATTPPAAASGGSSRSRPTSAATTAPRTPASARPPATGSCSGRPGMPTCTLSTGCTTASTW